MIWGQCNETLIDKLQLLQNRAARVITKVKYEDVDHIKLICQLDWLTIRNLIKVDLGIFTYKRQNKLLPETARDFHVPADKVYSYQTRSAVSGNVFLPRYDLSFTRKYTYLQNKRMRRCGVAPPPIILEKLKLPQQIIYRRKENLSESPNHQKYWENILVLRFYEQFSRNRRNLGHFRKFEKISNS